MPDPVTLAILSSTISGGAGLFSNSKARSQAKANRRVNELERERRGIQNNLARRRAKAEERRLQASIRAEALAAGVGVSSSASGAAASVDTQLSTELGISNQFEDLDRARTDQIQEAQKFGQQASTADRIGQIAGQIFGAFS